LSSITRSKNCKNYERYKNAKWLRPDELFDNGKEIKLFDSIDIDDIVQG